MDHETSDSNAWVDDRMASLDSSASWTPDADRAFRELSKRPAPGVPWLRLSLAAVTVTALVLVVAMLPWSQVWKPGETPGQTAEPIQPESTVENSGSLEVKPTLAESQPVVPSLESTTVASKTPETSLQRTGSPETRCKKTYNCQPIPGTGLAALEKASASQQQLAQAVQPIQVQPLTVPPIKVEPIQIQEDERTRLERQKVEEARRAGLLTSSSASQPFAVSPQGVTQPLVVHRVVPAYTEEAKAMRIQGTVIVDVTVNTDGSVTFESFRQRLGYGLDENARDAVVQWRFVPGSKDGAPVSTRVSLSVNFSLK
jgi:TonB family protein